MNSKAGFDFLSSNFCQVFKILYDNFACVRCCLRLLKIPENFSYLYQEKQSYIDLIQDISSNLNLQTNLIQDYNFKQMIKKGEQDPLGNCKVCLGLLQQIDQQEFLNQLYEKIAKEDYVFDSFQVAVKSPLSIQVRQLHMLLYAC